MDGVTKIYPGPAGVTRALDGITLGLARSTFSALLGPRGAGKSSLLRCASGMDQPTLGSVWRPAGSSCSVTTALPGALPDTAFTLSAGDGASGVRASCSRRDAGLEIVLPPARRGFGDSSTNGMRFEAVPDLVLADEPNSWMPESDVPRLLTGLRRLADLHGRTVLVATSRPAVAARADLAFMLSRGCLVDAMFAPTPEALERWVSHA
ncbi:hypothetical protein C1701_17180 [Actinoalloteichus sp. AHMU CJ021]|nr:hypothetical protein C1701_17180 [Actinoalloteichus sp. AHMU CJ021]